MRLDWLAPLFLVLSVAVAGCAGPVPEPTAPSNAPSEGLRLPYVCGAVPFDPALLDQPGHAEQGADPAAVALRELLASPDVELELPAKGWTLVGAVPGGVEFVARRGDRMAFAHIGHADGVWAARDWGGCSLIAAVDGASIATWTFSLDVPQPDPTSTRFTAEVTERGCASGREMGDRLLPPMIHYGPTSVVVVFAARPLRGGQDCAGNPSTKVIVELREPLGDRELLDGALYPPADPEAPLQ